MKKSLNKKAAIEMSISTIIVIVIGVTLLILGLVFVQNVYKRTTQLAEGAFERAEGKIGDFAEISKPLMISPERIELSKGNSKTISVTMANFDEKDASVKLTVSSTFKNEDLQCTFEETNTDKSLTYTIPSGEFRTAKILVESKEIGVLGNKSCLITANGLGTSIQDAISVKVVA